MSAVKRLTPPQSRKVGALVKRECCNCDNGHCILLDDGEECVCPQLISCSLLCKWFRMAVLPADKLLYAELMNTEDKKRCTECGASFVSNVNVNIILYKKWKIILYNFSSFQAGFPGMHAYPSACMTALLWK